MNASNEPEPQDSPADDCVPVVIQCQLCTSCRSWLPLNQFGRDRHRPSGHTKSCRDCRRKSYLRNRTQSKLRDAKVHQAQRAESYRVRFEALLSALPDYVFDLVPVELRPSPMQLRVHRAAHRKRSAGLVVVY